ncbi:hypothetical protein K4L44_14485 [Halosquirtibacter laminarini]|uniref:Uncharacterized protein n=1 Tax=Halosquirtibacter laminarini TaxID=3374600 RepID=A0AC61NK07_9BACT|nr:hypothetical protein K4L44_14485 [Prolixibacteraceae bacterium]
MMKKVTLILTLFICALAAKAQKLPTPTTPAGTEVTHTMEYNITSYGGDKPIQGGVYSYSVDIKEEGTTGAWSLVNKADRSAVVNTLIPDAGLITNIAMANKGVGYTVVDPDASDITATKRTGTFTFGNQLPAGEYIVVYTETSEESCTTHRDFPIIVQENLLALITNPFAMATQYCKTQSGEVSIDGAKGYVDFIYDVKTNYVGGVWEFSMTNNMTIEQADETFAALKTTDFSTIEVTIVKEDAGSFTSTTEFGTINLVGDKYLFISNDGTADVLTNENVYVRVRVNQVLLDKTITNSITVDRSNITNTDLTGSGNFTVAYNTAKTSDVVTYTGLANTSDIKVGKAAAETIGTSK